MISLITSLLLILGYFFASLIGHFFIDFLIPFATGILLYVTLVHLVPVSLKSKSGFILALTGFAFFFLLHLNHAHQH